MFYVSCVILKSRLTLILFLIMLPSCVTPAPLCLPCSALPFIVFTCVPLPYLSVYIILCSVPIHGRQALKQVFEGQWSDTARLRQRHSQLTKKPSNPEFEGWTVDSEFGHSPCFPWSLLADWQSVIVSVFTYVLCFFFLVQVLVSCSCSCFVFCSCSIHAMQFLLKVCFCYPSNNTLFVFVFCFKIKTLLFEKTCIRVLSPCIT